MFHTVNYLFATFLQTKEGGEHRLERVEKLKPGRAKFFFNITESQASEAQLKFHHSACMEFERLRKQTIDLCY